MADSSPTIIWVTNAEGGTQFVNRTYREFFGVTYEQVEGGKWQPLVHPDDAAEYVEVFLRSMRERTPFKAEARVRRADGEWRWVASHGELRFSSSGEFLGYVGISPDITELKRAEEALQKAKEELEQRVAERTAELQAAHQSLVEESRYLEAFFRHSITPLVFLDRNFNFIRVNEAYAKADQREVDEFPGHNHFEFYPSDAQAIFEEVVRTRKPFQVIARPFIYSDHPDWGVTYWDWTLTPLLDEHGEVEVLVFALEDVTVRKQAEIELEKHREHLEELVRERTRELEAVNAQLQAEITERQRAEEQLFQLNRTLRALSKSNQSFDARHRGNGIFARGL